MRKRNHFGFTLIEVMIAITILAGLTLLTARAMKAGTANKLKFEGDINREAAVRDALRVVERDINLAYHYRDTFADLMNQAKLESKRPANATPTPPPTDGAPVDSAAQLTPEEQTKPVPQWTGFVGDEKSIYFSALSNVRLNQDTPESDQAEIGYYTRNCKSSDGSGKTSTCLIRSVASYIDDELEKGGKETVLLENVVSFKLRYIGPGFEEWQNSWATKTAKRTEGLELFPYAVEIYLKTHNKQDLKDKPFEMGAVAALRFPNNDPKKEADAIANAR